MKGFSKTRKKSFAEQRRELKKTRAGLLAVLGAFLVFLFLTNLVIPTRSIETAMMNPSLEKGDRIAALSFKLFHFFSFLPFFTDIPLKRGDIVVVDFNNKVSAPLDILSAFTRFFTAGRVSPNQANHKIFVKRIIALPGDEISITNYVARVKPANGAFTLTEYECSDKLYENKIPESNALWDENAPFSGSREAVILKEGECFVLSDDRSSTNDSRTWGALPIANISAKIIFRYWPFAKINVL